MDVVSSILAMEPVVLAIDIGSSSTRTALFTQTGQRISDSAASKEYRIRYGPDGSAELSPRTLWAALKYCLNQTLPALRQNGVIAVGVSSFWHGLLGLDERWRPTTPIYTWADSRASIAADQLRQELPEKQIHTRTGCRVHASYWPAKLRWLGRESPARFNKVRFWVSPIDWLLHQLCGIEETTPSVASGTGLYQLRSQHWDQKIFAAVGISARQLLPVSSSLSGRSDRFDGVPIFSIGDGAASNIGSGADQRGIVALNVGTSAAARMIVPQTESRYDFGLFRYVVDHDRHLVGGAVSNAGNLRQWVLREMRLPAGKKTDAEMFDRKAAARDYLTAVPSWVAERAPTWNKRQGGAICGINQTTTGVEVGRALATSVFYNLAAILDLLAQKQRLKRIIISGGILKSPAAIRLLADAVGRDVELAPQQEASLRGAAIFALQGLGMKRPNTLRGPVVKHDAAFSRSHRERRARQETLARLLCSEGL